MKKIIVFSLLMMALSPIAFAQCDVKDYTNECTDRLKPLGFRYLKSYKLDFLNGSKKQIMHSYVFSSGTSYIITLANAQKNNQGLYVTIRNSEKKAIASSYLEKDKKYMPAITIACSRTGIYYLDFQVKEGKNYCGASVVGFKRGR
ncbi:MAG: hypothetical protein SFU27_11530 [Thermonemataceae bacterium]|nr:hypothetical protein [Thermonemataceae bacterium]